MIVGLVGKKVNQPRVAHEDHAIEKGYHNAMWLQSYTIVQGYFDKHSVRKNVRLLLLKLPNKTTSWLSQDGTNGINVVLYLFVIIKIYI
jgi:hypothetical protein